MRALARLGPGAALVLAAMALPAALGGYALSLLTLVGLQALATLGLTLLMGQAGQVSLAQAAFYGLGAYGSAGLALQLGLPPALSIPLATGGTAVIALALGLPSLRLGGHHLALATLGFGVILFLAFNEGGAWTGGPSGLIGIPRLAWWGGAPVGDRAYARVVWAVLLLALAGVRALLGSRLGRAFRAVAASEVAAASCGVSVARVKLAAFVIAGALAGMAGALYAHWLTFVSPAAFGLDASIELLVMAVVGGLGSVGGAPAGAVAVTLLVEALRAAVHAVAPGATGWVEVVAFGGVLIAVLLALPDGLAGGAARLLARWRPAEAASDGP